jgi:hypothetical protein
MNAVARLPAAQRRDLFTETGAKAGLAPFHVEKDFWVCWVLAVLFNDAGIGPNLTFRGGTSLSKAWGLIERFSEDVDLAMSRAWIGNLPDAGEPGLTGSERKRRQSALRDGCRQRITEQLLPALQAAAAALPERARIEVEPLEEARDPFCLHFEYPGTGLKPPAESNRAAVKVELSGRADGWPMERRDIRPYVMEQFPAVTGDLTLALSCVRPERTFWEKAALIHERNTRPDEKPLEARQARHLSDLVRLWQTGVAETAGFAALFDGVKAHRRGFFDYGWVDYEQLKPGDLRLVPPDTRLAAWRADYREMRLMFPGEPAAFEELVARLRIIEESLARL